MIWLILGTLLGCQRGPSDVILITVDTLRADHVGAFSSQSPAATPHIDSMAPDGIRFTRAYAPISVTGPSFATLLTGQAPSTHGAVMNVFRGGNKLGADSETLATRMRGLGYATGAFVSGHTLRTGTGLEQGFDTYDDSGQRLRRFADLTAGAAIEWLQQQRGPVLLWLHMYDPHGPLRHFVPKAKIGDYRVGGPNISHLARYQLLFGISDPDYYSAGYASGVSFADTHVGTFLAALRDTRRYRNAMLVFVADHGESLTERQVWFDHGTTAHEEQLRVPMIIKYPDGSGAGTSDDRLVGLMDVAPTILDVLGHSPLSTVDGVSLRKEGALHGLLVGESSHCKNHRILQCRPRGPGGKMFSARDRRHSLVRHARADGPIYELYDLQNDPTESTPLDATAAPSALRSAVDVLAAQREAMAIAAFPQSPRGVEGTDADPEIERLRALGYIE